ncbi:MAG: META domain-containing protein [Chloroflexi bacterium]|nr:META domain-containing protein [Chloroflexota bacterium]
MRSTVPIGPLIILLFLVAACGGGDPDPDLAGEGTWVLESLDGRPVIEESTITLRIGDNSINGIDGCNSYGGRSEEGTLVAGTDGVLSIPPFGATEMLCQEPEGVMAQADAYVAALLQGERFRIADDRLEILDSGGATRLIFVKRAPLPGSPIDLKGTAWRLLMEGDAMDGVGAPTLAFLDHRLVTGATACRSFAATYGTSEGALRFRGTGMLGSSQSWQSCAKNERILEGEFTDSLTWAREYSIDQEGGSSRLTIWSIRGNTLTFEPLPQAVEDITDTDWSLTAFVELRLDSGMWHHRTTEVAQGTEVTIEFDGHGISGFMGCNSYGGSAKVEDGTVTVDRQSFFSTAKLCEEPDGLIGQEKRHFSLVQQATRYGIYGDGLFMQTDDDVFLLFQSRPP